MKGKEGMLFGKFSVNFQYDFIWTICSSLILQFLDKIRETDISFYLVTKKKKMREINVWNKGRYEWRLNAKFGGKI